MSFSSQPLFPRRVRARYLALGLVLASAAGTLQAAELDVKTTLTQSGVWDSNPLLLVHGAKDLYGSTTSPRLQISDKTPTNELTFLAGADQNIFNQSSFNSTDLNGGINALHKSELWSYGLNSNVNYDTTRTSEITTFGRNTGVVRHTGYSAAPQVTYQASALDQLSIAGSFNKSQYDGHAFTDYHTVSVNPSWQHQFTPLQAGVLSLQANRYETDRGNTTRIDSIGPSVGWVAALSPRLNLQINGGSQASKQTRGATTGAKWRWDYVYSGNLAYKGEQDTTTLTGTRSRTPYANGTESLLTTFTVAENHKLNPSLTLTLGGSYQFADHPSDSASSLDYLASGRGGLTYHVTERFDVSTSYQYRHENLIHDGGLARESIAKLSLTLRPSWDNLW